MSKDNLGFEQKTEDGKTSTVFTLKKGTTVKFGSESFELAGDTEFCTDRALGRDALVGVLIQSGASGAGNDDNFAYTTQREVNGKTEDVEVRYDAGASPMYKLASDKDGQFSGAPIGNALPDAPAEAGLAAEGIAAGVSGGAGIAVPQSEIDKLDNPLQSMKSDGQLMEEFGAEKGSAAASKSTAKSSAKKAESPSEKSLPEPKQTVSPSAPASKSSKK